jgi:hypothetical protein
MTDPRRLLDGDATRAERKLLEAGLCEEPGTSGIGKTAAAIGVAAVVSAGTSIASAGKIGTMALIQWGTLIVAGGAGLVVGALWIGQRAAPPPAPVVAPAVSARYVPPAPPVRRMEAPAVVASATPVPERSPSTGRGSAQPPPASLREEVALIDVARQALSRGDASGALVALDRYAATHPRGMLSEEATLLRIESLAQSGNRPAAAQLARRFLATHPSSAHARRLSSLLEGSK